MITNKDISYIRELAKSSYYQSIYSLSKDLKLKITINELDFTDIQLIFLKYINFYSSLFIDIALGDIGEIVLENELYEDAYSMWKNKGDKNKVVNNKDANKEVVGGSRWIFKTPRKNQEKSM